MQHQPDPDTFIPRNSLDSLNQVRSSIDESPSVSRSSSKASSIDRGDNSNKPPKPRRPTNYAERKSSISSRPNLSGQLKNLSLNSAALVAGNRNSVPSPPVSAKNITPITPMPMTTTFTPILEQPIERTERTEESERIASRESNRSREWEQWEAPPYYPLPPPTRPEVEVKRAPATQMYWHQPPFHGMMATGPMRRSHSIAKVGSQFFIFGGSDGKAPHKATNTVFIFDAGRLSIVLADLDTSLWRIPIVSGTIPPALRAHTTTAYRSKIYLFGGGTGNNDYYNHVYMFNTLTHRWTCLLESDRSNPSFPTPRRAHTSVQFDSGMYIFGGGSGAAGLNDLWRLDFTRNPTWTQLHPIGRKPEPRVYHTATVVRDVMIIYGGLDGKQCFSNMYIYNFVSNTYTELIIPNGPRLCRISHTTTCVGSQLFIFGGSNGTVFNNELWIFDIPSKTWSLRQTAGTPPLARGYHVSVFYDSRLWVFGGMDTVWEGFTDVNVLEFGGSGYLGSVYVDHIR